MSEHWPKYGAATMLACATAGMLCAPPAQAEDGIDATALRQFGGRYAIDCTDPAGTQLHVAADALIVEQAGQRLRPLRRQRAAEEFSDRAEWRSAQRSPQ